jgi:hypothetical protein
MSWLDELAGEMLKNVSEDALTDWTFGFGDIQRVVDLVEKTVERNAAETSDAGRAAAMKAVTDPSHSFVKNPVFAPMGKELLKAELTFPKILRSALLIAIYSHTEFLLLSWCESISADPNVSKTLKKTQGGESYPGRYLRYLRDDAEIPLGDFKAWPEWEAVDGYRRARNCLAHRGGIVDDAAEQRQIGALAHIEIDRTGVQVSEPVVRLLPGACKAAAEIAQTFIGRVVTVAECDPRWNGPKRAT